MALPPLYRFMLLALLPFTTFPLEKKYIGIGGLSIAAWTALQWSHQKIRALRTPAQKTSTDIALITINGDIYDSSPLIEQLHNAAVNPAIDAILLKINSGGGLPGSSQAVFYEMRRAKNNKPIVALIENMCCSGAYYIASAADYIIAPAGATIGSIGVRYEVESHRNVKLQNLNGYNADIEKRIFTSGMYKAVGDPLLPLTPDMEVYIQQRLNNLYEQFCGDVAHARNLSLDALKAQEARLYNGKQAVEVGLVDAIGSLSDAYDALSNLLKKRGTTVLPFKTIDLTKTAVTANVPGPKTDGPAASTGISFRAYPLIFPLIFSEKSV